MRKQTGADLLRCECLDSVEAAHRRRAYPLMYCHMELLGHLDMERLKQAVSLSSGTVPEILCAYDFKSGGFAKLGYTAGDAVKYVEEQAASLLRQNLGSRPQLQIFVTPKREHDLVMVIMSHILADGEGFLQYLYLLAALYNGRRLDSGIQNMRDISPLLENMRVFAPTEQTKHSRHAATPPLRPASGGNQFFCLTSQIPSGSMTVIRQRAKQCGATLNDVFMTAYARVIASRQNINTVVLPCPADLRKFHPAQNALTVANMTGIYREIAVEIPPESSFTATLQQVHIEAALQKSRRRCFSGINTLHKVFQKVPLNVLEQAIKATYPLPPVSYTNCGVIDHEKLHFQNCSVQNCFLTGAYRLPPDFQLTVSSFRNKCTLNCTLIGTANDAETGQQILDQVKCGILMWAERGS